MTDPDSLKLRKKGSYLTNGGEIKITGVLQERRTADGRRHIRLNNQERTLLQRQQKIERAVMLFLDLEEPHTWVEIAADLGLSIPALKDLTKTKLFMDIYSAYFVELGHDPRVKMAQAAVADMLPLAVNVLRDLLTEARTPATVKLAAAREIFHQAGITASDGKGNDRGELATFLKEAGVKIDTLNLGLTPAGEVVDGEYRIDIPQLPESMPSSTNTGDPLEDIPA